ncbi:hypothetical protein HT105_24660, partial [Bacteroides fragilis]|nr:hypothetical protein [Bacteroides fragilis]
KTTKKDAEIDAKQEGVKPSANEAKDAAKAKKSSSKKSRTETDLLGSMEIPNDAYYGKTTKKDAEIDAKQEGVKPSANEAKDAAKAKKSS